MLASLFTNSAESLPTCLISIFIFGTMAHLVRRGRNVLGSLNKRGNGTLFSQKGASVRLNPLRNLKLLKKP